MEDRPALVLKRIRDHARDALRRGQKIDPQRLLDLAGGKRA